MPPHPFDQSTYQVRFEWGEAGLARLAASDVVVIVDVLGWSTDTIQAFENETWDAASPPPAEATAAAAARGTLVLIGGLRNAAAVAAAILAEQERRAARTSVAVIACGEIDGEELRFAVEDHLGAGAIIDALGALGIDHTAPDAAVAGESFRALRRATSHLLTASGTGRALVDAGRRDEVLAAARVDAASIVPVLRDGVIRAL